MDLHEQRMQCLKMAFELGGKPEAVLTAAQQLLDFLSGPPASTQATVTSLEPEPTTAVATENAPDPIAACGTALVMEEGGDLADAAVATSEVPPEAPAETMEAASPEASTVEISPEQHDTAANTEEEPAAEAAPVAGEEAAAEGSPAAAVAEVADPAAPIEETAAPPAEAEISTPAAMSQEAAEGPTSIN